MIARLQRWAVALVLGLVTVAALSVGHRDVGYVRDEGIYFEASRRYAKWLSLAMSEPGKANEPKIRDRHLAINHEHPALMKMVAGVSARWLAEPPRKGTQTDDGDTGGTMPTMPEGAAMRLPAQIMAGIAVALLFVVGAAIAGSTAGGLLAAGFFILLPRVWFHAGLHAFDVPVAVATLVVALAYRRALSSRGWALALGPILGVAIAVKHNALFLGPLLTLHLWGTLAWARWRDGRPIARGQWFALPLWSMAVLGPLTALALWPWLWTAPIDRITEYFAFHRQHNWYNMEFLGDNFNQPPMPMSYPAVLTWATVPTALLVLAAIGLVVLAGRELQRPPPAATGPAPRRVEGSFSIAVPRDWAQHDGLLLAILGLFPIALIALPSTPIFGGTKHWLTAYPFLALAAAAAWGWLWQRSGLSRTQRRWLSPVAVALVLGPAALGTARGHPYGLSQYAPLVGGPRGAARLGLGRGFWGHAIVPALPSLEGRRLYPHDLADLCRKQYDREGRWPPGAELTPLTRSDSGLIFHEMHMAADEIALQQHLGSAAPAEVISLHDVPLTSIHAR